MKYLHLITASLILNFAAVAQIDIELYGQPLVYETSIDTLSASSYDLNLHYYVHNNFAQDFQIAYSRERLAHTNGWFDQLVTDYLEYDLSNISYWNSPIAETIVANDSSLFNIKIYPENTEGCIIYKYVFYAVPAQPIDSLLLKVSTVGNTCYLVVLGDQTDLTSILYSATKGTLSIHCADNGNYNASLFNASGQLVSESNFTNNQKEINVKSLNPGMYICQLSNEQGTIKTEKFVVR